MHIDINCDMGEGYPHDEALMPYISSANIACGLHAGSESIMNTTINLCIRNNVVIGAHPGYADKENFGRQYHNLSANELYTLISMQVQTLHTYCAKNNAYLHHVKPHGALYNAAAKSKEMSAVIAKAIKDFDTNLILYGLSNSFLITEAEAVGLTTAAEVFADRRYTSDGNLVARSEPNAVITDEEEALNQAILFVQQKTIKRADTICIHGDNAHALSFAKKIHQTFKANNIEIKTI